MSDEDVAAVRRKLEEAAARYCEADKSDPFCPARVRLHLATGIASLANEEGAAGYYDCRPVYTEAGVRYIDRIRP